MSQSYDEQPAETTAEPAESIEAPGAEQADPAAEEMAETPVAEPAEPAAPAAPEVTDPLQGEEPTDDPADVEEFTVSMHRYLGRSPARLLGIAVPDLAGDRRAINQPGTDKEYPNWCLPLAGPDGMPVSLEQLTASPFAARLVRAVEE